MEKDIKFKKTLLYTSLEIFCLLSLMVLGGCFDFVNLEWDFTRITTAVFWTDTIVRSLQYTLAMMSTMIYIVGRLELNSKEYSEVLAVYREWWKMKEEKETIFASWVDRKLNPSIKKEKIKEKITKKLHKLSNHTKDIYKLEFQDAMDEINSGKKHEWSCMKAKKYYEKRTMLENFKNDDFLDKNINALSCKYPEVNPNDFTYYLRLSENNDSKWKVRNTVVKDGAKISASKVISVVLMSMAMILFVINPDSEQLEGQVNAYAYWLITYITRVIMMAISALTGLYMGNLLFKKDYIAVLENRTSILKQYANSEEYKTDAASYSDQIIQAYHKMKELESRTKEELEQEVRAELNQEYEKKFDNAIDEVKKELQNQSRIS